MSLNDIHVRSAKAGRHGLHHTELVTFNGYSKHPKGHFYVPNDFNVQNKQRIVTREQPQNSWSGSTFLNGSTTNFKFNKGSMSVLTHAYFQISVTNSTALGVTLAPSPFWVDRIDIVYGGKEVLTNITGQEIYLSLAFLSRDEFEQMAGLYCLSTAYATTGTALAVGASGVYYIPMFHLFNSARLHLDGLESEISLKLITQSSSKTLLAGTHPTVTDVSLILKGYGEPDVHRESRRSLYNNKLPVKCPYLTWQRASIIQTMAASSSYSLVLKTVVGNVLGFFFTIRPDDFTGATQGTYQSIASFDVQDNNSNSMLGGYVRLHEDQKLDCAELFSNAFASNKDWYFVPFTSEPAGDYNSGSNSGYQVFTGNEKLVINTAAGLVTDSYQIDVYALTAEHLEIFQGRARSLN